MTDDFPSTRDGFLAAGGAVFAVLATVLVASALAARVDAYAQAPGVESFRFFRRPSRETVVPAKAPADARDVQVHFRWKGGGDWAWFLGTLKVPATVEKAPTKGLPVGMRISCGAAGEVYVGGALRARYDNDKPALVLLSEAALPGETVEVAIQALSRPEKDKENEFSEAQWVLVDPARALRPVPFDVDTAKTGGAVPDGLIGLSQGGSLADHDDATALKLRQGRFRWFRMDNVLTGCVKEEDGKLAYDFADLDRRIDFIKKVGAEPILAASYMPQPFDAVADDNRHSAPKDYALWEDLCYRAAKHCLDRKCRVPYWEVWNEPNAGWIRPGPRETGSEPFRKLYAEALGKPAADANTVRIFEAYLKLYAATARGVRRADPTAWIGGPALASGPFENSERGHCVNGRGFAKGLMLWCRQEKLPLDFVSWHEYFHPPDVFRAEADAFRKLLEEFPDLKASVKSLMVTEWNEAWWADFPQDNEIGAAWCANTVTRAFLPAGIDRPCFFYVKQGDRNFRGDYGMLIGDNAPKPQYHVARMFNTLSGKWIRVGGEDPEVSCVAAWDERRGRLAILLVNFTDRYNLRRRVRVTVHYPAVAKSLEYRVDATHSNVYHDPKKSGLEVIREADWPAGEIRYETTLPPHSISLIELLRSGKPGS